MISIIFVSLYRTCSTLKFWQGTHSNIPAPRLACHRNEKDTLAAEKDAPSGSSPACFAARARCYLRVHLVTLATQTPPQIGGGKTAPSPSSENSAPVCATRIAPYTLISLPPRDSRELYAKTGQRANSHAGSSARTSPNTLRSIVATIRISDGNRIFARFHP